MDKWALYTYGYGGKGSVADLLSYVNAGAMIVDVRLHPNSKRFPQYNRETLRKLLGKGYYHLQQLGNIHYADGEEMQIANLEEGLEFLEGLLNSRPCVLLCSCADAEGCHRSFIVAEVLRRRPPGDVDGGHLLVGQKLPLAPGVAGNPPDPVSTPYAAETIAGGERVGGKGKADSAQGTLFDF